MRHSARHQRNRGATRLAHVKPARRVGVAAARKQKLTPANRFPAMHGADWPALRSSAQKAYDPGRATASNTRRGRRIDNGTRRRQPGRYRHRIAPRGRDASRRHALGHLPRSPRGRCSSCPRSLRSRSGSLSHWLCDARGPRSHRLASCGLRSANPSSRKGTDRRRGRGGEPFVEVDWDTAITLAASSSTAFARPTATRQSTAALTAGAAPAASTTPAPRCTAFSTPLAATRAVCRIIRSRPPT